MIQKASESRKEIGLSKTDTTYTFPKSTRHPQIQVGMWFEFDVLPPKHPWQFPRAVNAFLIAAPKVGGLS